MLLLALIGALVVSITITLGRTATCQSMAQTYPAPQPQKYVNLSTCIHSLPVCTCTAVQVSTTQFHSVMGTSTLPR